MIASGPRCATHPPVRKMEIAERHGLELSELARRLLETLETPKLLENSGAGCTGSVRRLPCRAAEACLLAAGLQRPWSYQRTALKSEQAREAGALPRRHGPVLERPGPETGPCGWW